MTSALFRLWPLAAIGLYLLMPTLTSAMEEHFEDQRRAGTCESGACRNPRPFVGDLGGLRK